MAYPAQPMYPGQDPLWGFFISGAAADQQMDATGLQRALVNSGFSGGYKPFSLETCRLMINMLDRDHSGRMGFNEFKELWAALGQWKGTFTQFDRDHSGSVDQRELHQAVAAFGYRLSPAAISAITKRYATGPAIVFDDFVACCVRLKAMTDGFRVRDVQQNGTAYFNYDDFIRLTLTC